MGNETGGFYRDGHGEQGNLMRTGVDWTPTTVGLQDPSLPMTLIHSLDLIKHLVCQAAVWRVDSHCTLVAFCHTTRELSVGDEGTSEKP
eukprot:3096922-Rhodomonas_salina.1